MTRPYVPVAITFYDEPVAIMNFELEGRGDTLPPGAEWIEGRPGWWQRPADDGLILDRAMRACAGRNVLKVKKLEVGDVPEDRSYRPAWNHDGQKFTIDMARARDWHRQVLRHERAQAFAILDGQWTAAVAQRDTAKAAQIEAERQSWRDAPNNPAIDQAETVDDLKAW